MTPHRLAATPDERAGAFALGTGLALLIPAALFGNLASSLYRYPEIGSAVLFPPYAITTAILILSRRRDWVWYILVDSAAHFVTHWPHWTLSWVLYSELANALRELVAALLLQPLFRQSLHIERIRTLGLFLVSAVVVAPIAGATIGAANVMAHNDANTYWQPWSAWYLSNALTGLTMLPACLAALPIIVAPRTVQLDRARTIEACLLGVALGLTCAAIFVDGVNHQRLVLPLYATLPVLIWAAVRFGPAGASLMMTIVTFWALWLVDRGRNPYAPSMDQDILTLQMFVLFTGASILCLATVAAARERAVQLYRGLLASLQDEVAILDARGTIVEVNNSWQRRAVRAPRRAVQRTEAGESFLDACRQDVQLGYRAAAEIEAGASRVLAREVRRFEASYNEDGDNGREWFSVTIEALELPSGGAVVTRSDVTATHEAQLEIEEHRRELSHLARITLLGQLSGAFAHELRQPLAAILSNADAGRRILRREPTDAAQIDSILQDIGEDDRRASAMIEHLRVLFTRGDRVVEPVDTHELVHEVLHLAHAELTTRHIETTLAIAAGLPAVPGNKVELQQVLLNLTLNACEAMDGRPLAGRRLAMIADGNWDGHVHLAVRDSGIGIAATVTERLFEPFVTTKADGLGLGLSISKTIVTAHGGRLWTEPNHGGGTTMHVLLPASSRLNGRPGADQPRSGT